MTYSLLTASLVTAMYEIGCCAGSLACAIIGEMLGRRYTILLGTCIMLGGTAFQCAVSTPGAMIGARIFAGLGMVSGSS
jgi:MFS family permease